MIKFNKNKSQSIDYGYKELKGNYHRFFTYAFLIAVVIHIIFIMIYFLSQGEEHREITIKIIAPEIPPPPIKYIQKAPRLAKEIDIAKQPESAVTTFTPRDFKFERAQVQMTTPPPDAAKSSGKPSEGSVFYGALTSGEGAGQAGWGIPAGASSYGRSFGVGGSGGWGAGPGADYGPQFASDVDNTRSSVSGSGVLSRLKDDLIDYSNFTDRFEGLIQQDPRNKKKVQGFLRFYQLQYRSGKNEWNGEPSWNAVPQALRILMDYSNSVTDVKIQLLGPIRLDSKELFDVPMIYMMGGEGNPLISKEETKNLSKYLKNGGFLFVDDGYAAEWAAFNKQTRSILKDALGYDAIFEKIPLTHQIYHCWEDFSGPPPGDDEIRPTGGIPNVRKSPIERYRYLEGIFINGRLAVVFSSKGYCKAWGEWRTNPSNLGGPQDNTRQLQFGLNIIIFALTQKGGIVDQTKQRLANESQK